MVADHRTSIPGTRNPGLRLLVLLVLVVPFFCQGVAGAEASVAGAATVADDTASWWAAAQAYIIADQGLDTEPLGLSSDPDWYATGQNNADSFGASVSGAGDVNGDGYADVIVGAYGYLAGADQGRAYLFYGSPTGLSLSDPWTATGESVGDGFGRSVAGAGDVNGDGYADVIVGAYTYPGAGRAYVFHGSSTGLNTAPAWTGSGDQDGDWYGKSVAAAGDVNGDGYADIIVGAERRSGSTGKAYVYHGSPSGLEASAAWIDFGPTTSNDFGASVAGAGDVDGDGYGDVLVGSPGYKNDLGRTYLYYGSLSGLSRDPDWHADGDAAGDSFGSSVAAAGDVNGDGYGDVIAGAYGAESTRGEAYVYHGGETGPSPTPDWMASGVNAYNYGISVAGVGDVNADGYADIAVGAPLSPIPDDPRGAAYLYAGSEAGLLATHSWTDQGETQDSELGMSVAGAGDVNGDGYADVIVGAPGYASGLDKGRAYVYHGSAAPPSTTQDWKVPGDNEHDYFGFVVTSAGDVNADGYADVLVGAPAFVGSANQGKAYLFLGSGDGLSTFPIWTKTGQYEGDRFGRALAAAGDVDGDGYGDVIVGAPGYPTGTATGRVYLYYGSSSGLSGSDPWIASGQAFGELFGDAVASGGDVDGDGYADLVVGAPGVSSGRGAAYVYQGSPTGPDSTPDWTATGEEGEWFGEAIAGAGDVNGDGYGDLLVGAPRFDNGTLLDAGKTYLYAGSASGLETSASWSLASLSEEESWGASVASAGDVNGDGYGDLVIGAPGLGGVSGFAQVFHGGPGWPAGTPSRAIAGEYTNDYFGASVSGAGDVNGDGYADVLVGAYGYDDGLNDGAGKAYVYLGAASGLASTPTWGVTGEAAGDHFGQWVAGAGDVNGDGFADILCGSYDHSDGHGAAYAYLGNGSAGRPVLAQQSRADGGGELVPPWGLSHNAGSFGASMFASHPAGRGAVKMQAEACPPGVPFGHGDCSAYESAVWVPLDAAPDGAQLVQAMSGLQPETLYRWRVRVLYAPLFVVRPHIIPPPNPAHGPWRRFLGQAFEADVRTSPCSRGVYVTPDSQSKGGWPGTTVRFVEQVKNTGDCADTFDVTHWANTWPTHTPATVGPLQPGAWIDVEVTVDIPADAFEGNFDNVAVRLTSQGDADAWASCSLGTHVVAPQSSYIYLPAVTRNWP
jgi:hypothetical protein